MVTRPTVLGSYWPNPETPSLSSLQTSRLRRSTTTWKLRDPNHPPFGELIVSYIYIYFWFNVLLFGIFFFMCVRYLVIVLLRSSITWLCGILVLFICVRFSVYSLWSAFLRESGVMSQSQVAVVWVGEYFREEKHTVDWIVMLNHPLSVTMNNSRLYTATPALPSPFASDQDEKWEFLAKPFFLQSRWIYDASILKNQINCLNAFEVKFQTEGLSTKLRYIFSTD